MNTLRPFSIALALAAYMQLPAAANAPATCLGCNFERADLHGADLRNVEYIGSNFSDANLQHVNFANAKLIGVNFSRSDVRSANFHNAILCVQSDDDVSCINLRDANVSGTDFRGALFCRGRHLSDCVPVTAELLRAHTHNTLQGAILP